MEGEILHDIQMEMQLVVVLALVASWMVVEVVVKMSGRQDDFLSNLTWISCPCPEIEGSGAVLVIGVALDVVDGVVRS